MQAISLWKDLTSQDASQAFRAVGALAGSPAEALAFLRKRVRPIPARDARPVGKLLADLDDEQFAVRNQAEQALLEWGEEAVPALCKALGGSLSLEVCTRAEKVLAQLESPYPAGEVLRGLWTVELLEHVGTPEARELLKVLADGEPKSWVTLEAKASLQRLGKHGPEKN